MLKISVRKRCLFFLDEAHCSIPLRPIYFLVGVSQSCYFNYRHPKSQGLKTLKFEILTVLKIVLNFVTNLLKRNIRVCIGCTEFQMRGLSFARSPYARCATTVIDYLRVEFILRGLFVIFSFFRDVLLACTLSCGHYSLPT